MNEAPKIASNVIQLITMDILESTLRHAENPGRLGEYLTIRIRELIGGRMVVLLQFRETEAEPRIVSVCPTRRGKVTKTDEFRRLYRISEAVEKAEIWSSDKGPPEAREFIRKNKWENSLAVPLRVGADKLGLLLVFHIMDNQRLQDGLLVLDTLTTVMALVLRNSLLYEEQEAIIEARTRELSRKERLLMESEKMAALGKLVAGVSHEINTPVGICITAASSLVDKTKNLAEIYNVNKMKRADLEGYLNSAHKTGYLILNNMKRTGDLIQNFKQVAVDQTSERPRSFGLKAYLQKIIQSLDPKFEAKGIQIEIVCDEEITIESYPGVFAQIFTNLVMNSVVHGFEDKEEGNIRIAAEREDRRLNMLYQDNGKGIPPDVLPKIFDPFFTTNMQTGTGLGMHIVFNIVTQKLKGSITCESEPDQGVMFKITIPVNNIENG